MEKVYVTKWLLTYGILICNGEISENNRSIIRVLSPLINLDSYICKPYWHNTQGEAIDHMYKILERKINSSERLLKRLKSFKLEISDYTNR
jgi:hypothetical protein